MEVEFYEFEHEEGLEYKDRIKYIPAMVFINEQDIKLRAKILRTVMLLEEKGISLREPHSKPLEDGIFELRTKFGSDIARNLYFFCDGDKAIITNGFLKKTQKTPSSEIEKAKKYRDDYFRQEDERKRKEKKS